MWKIILLGWIVGISLMGRQFEGISTFSFLFIIICLIVGGYYVYRPDIFYRNGYLKGLLIGSLTLLMFGAGYLYADHALVERLKDKEVGTRQVSTVIYVRHLGERSENGVRQPAEILSGHAQFPTWLLYINEHVLETETTSSLIPGQYYQLIGTVKPVHGYANAGGFDQEKWFVQQNWMSGFHVQQLRPVSTDEIYRLGFYQHLKQQQGFRQKFLVNIELLRLKYRNDLQQQPFTNKALMLALLTGDRSLLDKKTEDLFQRFGITHLLAISGPHVLILAAFMTWLMTFAIHKFNPDLYLKCPRQILIILPFCCFVLLYTAFVGFEIPALRTLLLVCITSVFLWLNHEARPFFLLVFTASICLLIDPFSILSAAFWLSYGACFILLNIYQSITLKEQQSNLTVSKKLGMYGKALIESQWKIFIALLPLVLVFFKQVSWIAPVTNLIAIPFLGGLIVPLNIMAGSVELLIPSLGHLLFQLNDFLISAFLFVLHVLDQIFNPALYHLAFTPLLLMSFSLGIFLLFLPRNTFPKIWVLLCIIPVGLSTFIKPDTQIAIIDVGQGQSIFVQDNSERILIDTGGYYDESKFSIGENVVIPYLRQKGINHLDKILLSHLDQDHSGALDSILSEFPVQKVLANETLSHAIQPAFSRCYAGQQWQTEKIKINILSPQWVDDQLVQANRNEYSCVVYIEFLESTKLRYFLIMGDAGWEREYQFLQQFPDLKVDVLVLGHHGSKNSSSYDFLEHYRPKLAIASAGYDNRYGHPSVETQARLKALHIPLYTTIKSGTLSFTLQDNEMELKQYRREFKWLVSD